MSHFTKRLKKYNYIEEEEATNLESRESRHRNGAYKVCCTLAYFNKTAESMYGIMQAKHTGINMLNGWRRSTTYKNLLFNTGEATGLR